MKFIEAPLHPWLFAAYPLAAVAASNYGQVAPMSVLLAVCAAWLALGVLAPIAGRLCGSRAGAALLLSLLTAMFFCYGNVHTELELFARRAVVAGNERWGALLLKAGHLWLSSAALLVLLGALLAILRLPGLSSPRLAGALNVAGLFLLGTVSVQAGYAWSRSAGAELPAPVAAPAGSAVSALGYNPDIYHIVLDGYARADVLRDYYGHDNEPFLAALRERGFGIGDGARVNYNWTFLSLTSVLNFDYLHTLLPGALAPDRSERGPIYQALRDNRVARFLRERGYRIVHLRSSWSGTVENPFADDEIGCGGSPFENEYLRAIAEISWLKVMESAETADLAACHLGRLQALGAQARRPGPKFVFAHFVPPHHPYLFDSRGEVLRHATIANQFDAQARLWDRRDAYLEQLKFVNATMIDLVERLLAESARPPVIIIQSDHGPGISEGLSPEEWLHVRFANLLAAHLPAAPQELVPTTAGPVNLYRYLFNHYFQANLPILPERRFVSPYGRPYAFKELR